MGATIIAAVVLLILCTLCLAIGYLIKGKVLRRGSCGMVPKQKGEKKSDSCSMCGRETPCEKEEKKP